MNSDKTGEFIKYIRNEKGMTQKQLAEKLNCTDKAVSRWETGKGMPDVSYLLDLSDILEVSVNEILLGERIAKEEETKFSNEILVDTISQSNKKISKLNIFISVLFCVLQTAAFYLPIMTMSPSDGMGVIFFHILSVWIISFVIGFTKTKFKFFFPVFTTVAYLPAVAFFGDTDVLLYCALYLSSGYVLVFLAMGISALIKYLIKKI